MEENTRHDAEGIVFSDFCSRWKKLAASTGQADPFCCAPIWNLSFHQVFDPRRRLVFQSESDSALVFAEEPGEGKRILLTPVEASWFFGNPLLGPDSADWLLEALLGGKIRPSLVVLSGIQPEDQATIFLRFAPRFSLYRYGSSVQCGASLEGGLDGFLSRRSANHRAKIRKAARRARKKGITFERHVPATAEEAAEIYERLLRVELSSWKGLGHCGMAESPAREFYACMLPRLAENREARVMFARYGEEDIGFIFGGMLGGVYRGQQFSYAASWKDWGIGNILQLEQVAWLCEEGAERYDMGPITGPRMEYKAHWTELRRPIETWLVKRRG